jgi:hypothetical protein
MTTRIITTENGSLLVNGAADLGSDHTELDLLPRLEDRDVTHLRYRVRRSDGAA